MYPTLELPQTEARACHPEQDELERFCDWVGVQVDTKGDWWTFKAGRELWLRELLRWNWQTGEWRRVWRSERRRKIERAYQPIWESQSGKETDAWRVAEMAQKIRNRLVRELEP